MDLRMLSIARYTYQYCYLVTCLTVVALDQECQFELEVDASQFAIGAII